MNALLAQFIPEARDLLEQAGTGMLALEQDAGSQSVINDVFRAVHTLKGSSGHFDVMPLTRLVHAAEDLLGEVRTGDLALTSEIVDRLLDSLDVVGRWIDALEAREALPIVRLARSLGLERDANEAAAEEEAVMVVRVGRERVGMVVDGFRERLEVIVKPLEGVLGFSGTALLGDGRVLLILDLQDLV